MALNVKPTGQGHRQPVGRGMFERKLKGECGVTFFF